MDNRNVNSFDPNLLRAIDEYIERLFVADDAALSRTLERSREAGLPEISVSPNQGKLLYLLARIAQARRVLEIGTLGGYSTTWFARALPVGGIVISLELNRRHAEVARANLRDVAPGVDIQVGVGDAEMQLRAMIDAREPPFDVVFIDADKPGYVRYLELSLRLSRPGTVILADNLIRHGAVLDRHTTDDNAQAARAYNEAIAAHPRLESIVLPVVRETIDGLSISIVKDDGAS